MSPVSDVTNHYSFGGLRERIQAGIERLDGPPTIDSLGAVDEFHVGGRLATRHLIDQVALTEDDLVLDIGSGLGGTARLIASHSGAQVCGVDLTEEYVDVATWLTGLVGLQDRVSFQQGSAIDLPWAAEDFSAATMCHVGMNIADKATLCTEAARVLKPGGRFAIYDIVAIEPDASTALSYPVPWAASDATSALASADTYQEHLTAAGFEISAVSDRREAALTAFAQLAQAVASSGGPPPLGLHLVMGPDTSTKVSNMVAGIRDALIAPTEIIARRV